MKYLISIALIVFALSASVWAQESTPEIDESSLAITADESAGSGVSDRIGVFTAWDFVRMVLILAAVIAVIYGIVYLLKRSGNPRLVENRLIRVVSSKSVTQGNSLHLVEVGNHVYLLGAGDGSVSMLAEIADKETLDGLRLDSSSTEAAERRSFGDTLAQMFGKKQGATAANPVDFLRQQRRRVRQM